MKLFGSDYDGTLFRHQQISQYDLEQIAAFRAAGHRFGLVTGRSLQSTQKEIEKYGLELDFVITNNGGVVRVGDTTLFQAEIDFSAACALLEILKQQPIASYVINDGFARSKTIVNKTIEDLKYGTHHDLLTEEALLAKGRVAQIVCSLIEDDTAFALADLVNTKFKATMEAFVNVNCVDIVPKGIDKAKGLACVARHFDIETTNIYAVGDSYNDVPMLSQYHGFLIETEDPVMLAACNTTTTSVGAALAEVIDEDKTL
ncbi:MAG: HAD-IIB family hydrolase [Erysipelotrichaceae bacterium]